MKDQSSPKYSIPSYVPTSKIYTTPAPNQYRIPGTVGCKIPDKQTAAAYTIHSKYPKREKLVTPGPAHYGDIRVDAYKMRAPKYTIGVKCGMSKKQQTPGPADYAPRTRPVGTCCVPFGIRGKNVPYITADDRLSIIDINKQ